jgi:hypothetical protein
LISRSGTVGIRTAVAAAVLCIATLAQAQVSPKLLGGMHWRNVGPFIAGKVDSVSGASGQPSIGYVGTDNGGVWKTVNAGVTWHPLTDAVHAIRGITALAVAPSQASVVYAGTGSIFGTQYGSGVWKSTDAGAHWQSAAAAGCIAVPTAGAAGGWCWRSGRRRVPRIFPGRQTIRA